MVWCVELCVGVWMVCCMELGARELGMHSAMGMEAGMAFAHARVGQHVRDACVVERFGTFLCRFRVPALIWDKL